MWVVSRWGCEILNFGVLVLVWVGWFGLMLVRIIFGWVLMVSCFGMIFINNVVVFLW